MRTVALFPCLSLFRVLYCEEHFTNKTDVTRKKQKQTQVSLEFSSSRDKANVEIRSDDTEDIQLQTLVSQKHFF